MARQFIESQAQQVGSDDELSIDEHGGYDLEDSFIDDNPVDDSSFVVEPTQYPALPDLNSDDDGDEDRGGEVETNGPTFSSDSDDDVRVLDDSVIGINDSIEVVRDVHEFRPPERRSVTIETQFVAEDITHPRPSTSSECDESKIRTPKSKRQRECQTTPSLNPSLPHESAPPSPGGEDINCPVCLAPWTTNDEHRLVSLKCGHLFGKICIETWLVQQGSKKGRCPTCNSGAKKSDVRPLYVRNLKALDTEERENLTRELEKERELRMAAEKKATSHAAKLKRAEFECENLKRRIMENALLSDGSKIKRHCPPNSNLSPVKSKFFTPGKVIEVSKSGSCRVMAHSSVMGYLCVSQPSNTSLFPGHGVRIVSAATAQIHEFVPIHSGVIKDAAFKPNDALLLTASVDKTVKLTNMMSRSVVTTFRVDGLDAWSCCWNTERTDSFYVGLRNGSVVEWDLRMPSEPVLTMAPFNPTPMISLQYVPTKSSSPSHSSFSGLLCNGLSSTCFYKFDPSDPTFYQTHSLPFEGRFLPGAYDVESGYGLVACRPSPKNNNRLTHSLIELIESETDDITANIVRSYQGGSQSVTLSKSKIVSDPLSPLDRNVFVFAADESANGAIVWESKSGKMLQNIRLPSPVLDIELLDRTDDRIVVSMLTDRNVCFFERRTN
ncbi:E3 ubiquitin-protein ligase RFWD3 [Halotydeus destructor]|nr:E3 ubiquitin-protein ligase RFWD3 [Halotydeus destructor]